MAFGDGGDWESQKMLDVYIHDYLMKRNMREVAAIFSRAVNITINPPMIDSPNGFLSEWWSIFWDIYSARIPRSRLAMPSGHSVQAIQKVVNEQQNNHPNVPKSNVNHQNFGKLPSLDFDNMVGQFAENMNHQNFKKLPMSLDFNNNMIGQSFVASVNHQNFGKLPMSSGFDNNMMGESTTSVNHQNSRKLPMSPSFNNNMIGQFATSVNYQNSGKLPMSSDFDNNMMGQSTASVNYQNFEKPLMSTDFDNNMMGQFIASVNHQNFRTLPMSPNINNNMMGQHATNVNHQNYGKPPMSTYFDNSMMGQFATNVNYQNSGKLPMSSSFNNNMMGQSATSVNHQNFEKLPMTLGFNSNMMGQSSATSVLASKIYEEEHSKISARDLDSNMRLLDVDNFTLLKASSSRASNSQLQIPRRVAPQQTAKDNNYGAAFGGTRSMDSSLFVVPKPPMPRARSRDAGMPKGVNLASLKGRAMAGLDKNPLRMPYPVLNSLPVPNQQHQLKIPPTPHHQQELSSQGMANAPRKQISFQGCSSNIFSSQGMANAPGSLMLPRVNLSPTTVQRLLPRRQESQEQMMMPMKQAIEQQMTVPEKQITGKKIMMAPLTKQTVDEQQKDQVMQQQMNKNNKKRKSVSSSQAEEKNALDGKNVVVEKPSDDNIEAFLSNCVDDADICNDAL